MKTVGIRSVSGFPAENVLVKVVAGVWLLSDREGVHSFTGGLHDFQLACCSHYTTLSCSRES